MKQCVYSVSPQNEAGWQVLVTLANPTQSKPVWRYSTMPDNPITNNSVRSDGSQETLSDYVRRIRNEKRLSCKDIEKQSARFGKPIAGSYVNRIENNPAL